MCLGEIRPLLADGWDLDKWYVECGNQIPPPDCLQADDVDGKKLCDSITFEWAVDSEAEQSGNGEFLYQGRAALFLATEPGEVTISVTILDHANQEPKTDSVSFVIEPIHVRELAYSEHYPVLMDALDGDGIGGPAGSPYGPPHWKDTDLDGQASEVGIGERRYPVAYSAGRTMHLDHLALTSAGQLPFLSARIRGYGPDNSTEPLFSFIMSHDQATGNLVSVLPEGESSHEGAYALPSTIQAYDPFRIQWEVSFANDRFFSAGITDNYIYLLLPTSPNLNLLYETACYISCSAAEGQAGDAGLISDLINYAFNCQDGQTGVRRKPYHGGNRTDNIIMGYHVAGPSDNFTAEDLLASLDGNGACVAWAQLLQMCWAIQGIDSAIVNVAPAPQTNGFAINDMIRLGPGTSGYPAFPDVMNQDVIQGVAGIGAQNNLAPWKYFGDHALVLHNNVVYDPSYGDGWSSSTFSQWEDGSLWGLRIEVTSPPLHIGREQQQNLGELVFYF